VAEVIDLGEVERFVAGAVGPPGKRTFLLQGRGDDRLVTVVVEKQQVSMLARGVIQLLDQIATQTPDEPEDPLAVASARLAISRFEEPHTPLFRVRQLGIGYDRDSHRIVFELHEWPDEDDDDDEVEGLPDPDERRVLRLQVTRVRARAMALVGLDAVRAGRPICPLCQLPRDPDGHKCPSVN
jgi:uncharacterized repeat protein (TIGR03847 family)